MSNPNDGWGPPPGSRDAQNGWGAPGSESSHGEAWQSPSLEPQGVARQAPQPPQQSEWQQPQPLSGASPGGNWQAPHPPQQGGWQPPQNQQPGGWQAPHPPQQGGWQPPQDQQPGGWQAPPPSGWQPSQDQQPGGWQAPQPGGWQPPGPQSPPGTAGPAGWHAPGGGPPLDSRGPQYAPQAWHAQQGHGPVGQPWSGGNHPLAAPQGKKLIYPNNPNPTASALVSFFLPGVGQMMLGQTSKGIIILGAAFFTACFGGLLNIVAAVDAYQVGKKLLQGRPVGEMEMF